MCKAVHWRVFMYLLVQGPRKRGEAKLVGKEKDQGNQEMELKEAGEGLRVSLMLSDGSRRRRNV